jgi:hypothetical protein
MLEPVAYIVSDPQGYYVARYAEEWLAEAHVLAENEELDEADDETGRWDWGFEWSDGHVTFDGTP